MVPMKTITRTWVAPSDPVCQDCDGYGAKQNIGSQMDCPTCQGKGRVIPKGATAEVDDRTQEEAAEDLLDAAKEHAANAASDGAPDVSAPEPPAHKETA